MKLKDKQGDKNQTGAIGEAIVAQFITDKGYRVLERNYLKKWGEIDLVAQNGKVTHFIEVKTLSYASRSELEQSISRDTWRPEDNVHLRKLKKVARTAETWLLENNCQSEWQIDVAAVRIVPLDRFAVVKIIQNVTPD